MVALLAGFAEVFLQYHTHVADDSVMRLRLWRFAIEGSGRVRCTILIRLG